MTYLHLEQPRRNLHPVAELCSARTGLGEEVDHVRGCWQQVAVGLTHDKRFQALFCHGGPHCSQRASYLAKGALRLRDCHWQDRKDLMGQMRGRWILTAPVSSKDLMGQT